MALDDETLRRAAVPALLLLIAAASAPALAGARMTLTELRALALSVGFPASAVDTAAAIAMAESGGDASIVGDGGTSFGLWQVHVPAHPEYSPALLVDPTYNARAALAISRGGTYWQPWSTWTSGAYRQFLPVG